MFETERSAEGEAIKNWLSIRVILPLSGILRREETVFELKQNEKTNETDFFNSL